MTSSQFTAEIQDIKIIYNILKAISFKEFGVIRPLEEGLKITVDDLKTCETSIYVTESVFSSYYVDIEKDIHFKISLKVLTECLHIYGDEGNPSLKFSYKGPGNPLNLVIKHSEENILVDCQLHTLDDYNSKEIVLSEACNINKLVFNGEQFNEVLSDLDMLSDDFELEINVSPPLFRITTTSILGESALDVPKNSEMVLIYQCKEDFKAKYTFASIRQVMRVLSYAKNVSILTGDSGLLGFQLTVASGEKKIYIEYYVTALIEDDD